MLLCWSRRFRSKTPRRINQDVLYAILGALVASCILNPYLVWITDQTGSSGYFQSILKLPPGSRHFRGASGAF